MELKPIRTGDPAISRGVTYDAAEIAAAEQGQKVLRNTYLLLALTMVPTVIGAFIGMATAGVIMAHPIIGTFVMLAAVIGLQFGIAANRNSALGILLLLLMTGLLGWWLGPILNFALEMKNGAALVGYAGLGTGAIFHLDAGDRGVLAVPALRPEQDRARRRNQLRDRHNRRLHEPVQHLRQPAQYPAHAGRRTRLIR
jgi:hypothetical protein